MESTLGAMMLGLQIYMGNRPPAPVVLSPGIYRVGRADQNQIVINDPSIAPLHAEFRLTDDGKLFLRNLSGLEATTLNGRPVKEARVRPGDMVQVGRAMIAVEPETRPGETDLEPALSAESEAATGSFLGSVLTAFRYPCQTEIMMIIGALAVLGMFLNFLPGPASLIAMLVALAAGIYLLALFREIILSTVRGENEASAHVSLSLDWPGIRETLLPIYAIALFAFLPATLVRFWPDAPAWLAPGLGALAVAYVPMALLLVIITEDFWLANPWSVGVSIARAPLGYLIVTLFLALLLGLGDFLAMDEPRFGSNRVVNGLLGMIFGLVELYLAFVWARILGLYYRFNESRLGWYH